MFLGDLVGLSGAFIDGKLIGDVNVESVHLGSSAAVHGDVTCRSLQMDGGAAVVGRLEVSPRTLINSDYDETKSIIEGNADNETDGASLGSPSPAKPEPSYEEEKEPSPIKPVPKKNYRTVLFIMEPQVDFYPGGKCGGKGPVGDDQQAADRMAEFIYSHIDDIDDIVITLDSHNVGLSFCCPFRYHLAVTLLCAYLTTEDTRGARGVLGGQTWQRTATEHADHHAGPARGPLASAQGREHGA